MAPEAGPQGEVCANCGAALPPNAKFCMECGTRVERQPQMVRPTHCQNCGAELPPNAKFCLECGTKVDMIPAGSEKPVPQPVEATYQQQAAESPAAASPAPLPSTPDVAIQPVETATPVPQPATASNARTYDFAEAAAAAPAAAPPQAPTPTPAAQSVPVTPAAVPSPPAPISGGGPRLVGSGGTTISLPPKNELVIGREDPISGIHPDIDMTAHGGEAGGVSRRHALLRQQNGQWSIVDLDSTNYTRVDGSRVAPHDTVPLHEGARVQFGRIEFEFHAQ
jgi:ribosomal protein L40E